MSLLKKGVSPKSRNNKILNSYKDHNKEFNHAIIFCVNCEHANAIAELINSKYKKESQAFHNELISPDASCITLTGKDHMNGFDRGHIIKQFKDGKIKTLVTVQLLIEGFDFPEVDAIFLACPTTSTLKSMQMIGRGLRGPAVGGTESCLLFDYSDQVVFHHQKHEKHHIKLVNSSDALREIDSE